MGNRWYQYAARRQQLDQAFQHGLITTLEHNSHCRALRLSYAAASRHHGGHHA